MPSYYKKHSGFLIAAAIDKYVYLTVHQTFVPELIVKYSKLERVAHASELQHPIIREALKLVGIDGPYVEPLAEGAGEWRGSRNQRIIALPGRATTYFYRVRHS